MAKVRFCDLNPQISEIQQELRSAMDRVLCSADFILGESVKEFEENFARYLGAQHAAGTGSGLDALTLTLQALGIGPGDEVIVPVNTFIATALAVSQSGALPRFVDCCNDSYQIDPEQLHLAITSRTRAVIPVHLYGQAADMEAVGKAAEKYGLKVIEDAAQAHGALFNGRRCGTIGKAGCFSFYPSKNLGAFGDGGMVVTDDEHLAERIRWLRHYGQSEKNVHDVRGTNSRLDTLQAAILNVKLKYLDRWNGQRQQIAALYTELLSQAGIEGTPQTDSRSVHVYHLYVIKTPQRDRLKEHLAAKGIETGIHYPTPIHLQPAYQTPEYPPGSFPEAEKLSKEILSLPIYPGMADSQVAYVVEAIKDFFAGQSGEKS